MWGRLFNRFMLDVLFAKRKNRMARWDRYVRENLEKQGQGVAEEPTLLWKDCQLG